MKIMQINAVANIGSTGRTTIELADVLKEQGHNYYIVYSEKRQNSTDENLYQMVPNFGKKMHAFLSRLFGLQGYFSTFSTLKLLRHISSIKPDVITLRNLHGNYINIPILLNYIANNNIPTVVVLHDCFFYTGRCMHYSASNCSKWQTGCFHCPRLKKDNVSWFFDRSKKMYKDKKYAFSKIKNLAVIGVSDWVTNEAKKSFLKDAKIIRRIYNWVHTDTFKPIPSDIRRKLNLEKKFVILGIASNWTKEKGVFDFIKLSKLIDENSIIFLIGEMPNKLELQANIINVKSIDKLTELAKYYSLADVFLNLSIEETFGKVTAEALACGTPAIVYDTTGCAELIKENTGFVVPVNNINSLKEKILEIKEKGKAYYSDSCISHARENFDYKTNAKKYIELYNEMIINHLII
jgi:glycosyltransferase involved in cell wall biosynthesis